MNPVFLVEALQISRSFIISVAVFLLFLSMVFMLISQPCTCLHLLLQVKSEFASVPVLYVLNPAFQVISGSLLIHSQLLPQTLPTILSFYFIIFFFIFHLFVFDVPPFKKKNFKQQKNVWIHIYPLTALSNSSKLLLLQVDRRNKICQYPSKKKFVST